MHTPYMMGSEKNGLTKGVGRGQGGTWVPSTSCLHIAVSTDSFHHEKLLFLDTKKNVIIDGSFTKLIYSEAAVVLNAIYIYFPIQSLSTHFGSNYVSFSLSDPKNISLMKKMAYIENEILHYYRQFFGISKSASNCLATQLLKGNIKVYQTSPNTGGRTQGIQDASYILKISGVWETENQIGITFKFIV